MGDQISMNVRYLMWRKDLPSTEWEQWLSVRTNLAPGIVKALVKGTLQEDRVSANDLRELARVFVFEDEGETLRFTDLVREGSNILQENLRFLIGSQERGGKATLARDLGVDATTISRWLRGSYEPQPSSLERMVSYFGLPTGTDLRQSPLFLSVEPVAPSHRRKWLHRRIDALPADELRDLYPALRRLLEER